MSILSITVQTDWRLTKNGIKKSAPRTVQGLTRKHREIACRLAIQKKQILDWKPLKQCEISITSYYARRPMDFDGLACAMAPTIDGIVDAGVIPDDSPNHILKYSLSHVKVPTMAEVRVEVCISGVQK